MIWVIVIIGLFAALTVGRIIWEKATGQTSPASSGSERKEWSDAIR